MGRALWAFLGGVSAGCIVGFVAAAFCHMARRSEEQAKAKQKELAASWLAAKREQEDRMTKEARSAYWLIITVVARGGKVMGSYRERLPDDFEQHIGPLSIYGTLEPRLHKLSARVFDALKERMRKCVACGKPTMMMEEAANGHGEDEESVDRT